MKSEKNYLTFEFLTITMRSGSFDVSGVFYYLN